jgi:hypothetical protein
MFYSMLPSTGIAIFQILNQTPLISATLPAMAYEMPETGWSIYNPVPRLMTENKKIELTEKQAELVFKAFMDSLSDFKGPIHLV